MSEQSTPGPGPTDPGTGSPGSPGTGSGGADPSTSPDPAETAGLEPGTGVTPGDTPPAEASATAEYATQQEPPPVGKSPWLIGFAVLFGLFLLLIVVGMVGRAISVF